MNITWFRSLTQVDLSLDDEPVKHHKRRKYSSHVWKGHLSFIGNDNGQLELNEPHHFNRWLPTAQQREIQRT